MSLCHDSADVTAEQLVMDRALGTERKIRNVSVLKEVMVRRGRQTPSNAHYGTCKETDWRSQQWLPFHEHLLYTILLA